MDNSDQMVGKLAELARNHRWSWDGPTARLLSSLPGASSQIHPTATVSDLDEVAWRTILDDAETCSAIDRCHQELRSVLEGKTAAPTVAYVSAEFGISELLPQYSGGLGILAGDHLKAASDLGVPLVAVGLFYRGGFFRQVLDGSVQAERYEQHEPERLGYLDTGQTISVDIGDESVTARVWRLEVGAVDLYVLDTDLPSNDPAGRAVADRLYSGDQEHRIRQEMLLGIGGRRALSAVGIEPKVVHLNEGHAAFWLLEQIETAMVAGATYDAAVEKTRSGAVFTTHTPVPAGIDRFERSLVAKYLTPWSEATGVALDDLFDLASDPNDAGTPLPFNMAALCLALSGSANGVSKLHGHVSRELFSSVPGGSAITSVTNGVHARTWVAADLADLFDARLGRGWDLGEVQAWEQAGELDDADIRAIRRAGRQRLIDLVRSADLDQAVDLDPDALTIGFARRFATYKRADLLLALEPQLVELLADDSRPVQFVFAGKAHPADGPGKAAMTNVVEFARSEKANGRFVFVPDYEMAVARVMYAGCDVWLNNPIRPHEASGTSGEKSALNGGLQLSIPDGWWDEMYDGENGWVIPSSSQELPDRRDLEEAAAVHRLLADEVVPLFYDDGSTTAGPSSTGPALTGPSSTGPSTAWLHKVKHSWTTLGPQVTAARMVADYRDRIYEPALNRSQAME